MAPTVAYWGIRGLAQPIRYMLHYTGTTFEDKQYTDRAVWASDKQTLGLEFPNLPYYIDGDVKITESQAIHRHLGRKHDLLGSSEADSIRLDMSIGVISDLSTALGKLSYSDDFETLKGPFIADMDSKMKKMSNIIGSGNFALGAKISIVDFSLYELLERYMALVPDCMSNFANLVAFHKRFAALPAIKKYRDSPAFQTIKSRFNGPSAKFGAATQ